MLPKSQVSCAPSLIVQISSFPPLPGSDLRGEMVGALLCTDDPLNVQRKRIVFDHLQLTVHVFLRQLLLCGSRVGVGLGRLRDMLGTRS